MTDTFIRLDLSRREADLLLQVFGHHILGDSKTVQSIYNRLADIYEGRRLPCPEPLPYPFDKGICHAYGDRQLLSIREAAE